ncbi:hypothetical protein [Corynebacterium cystitidis]|uniref:Uncharacterized protein n=1 Tax=Corynebacterium cystitidis DSM 20524 TaxID=1121357 RepID=A0A1H9PWK9_9CORY|nr:hypothetical protein [Corynebacterium cystitidis]WJY82354.1 hypothetical protein CCYS_07145 [Corynebacterium cystitidis DSM 20524]SER52562.1 hypothetical protein SAMN05661109_00488 [Corynebacterium cystitidis DSM 20524]SNV76262.1 Uncharacterised protein [Corynebacterium cystitidis]
MTHRLRLGLAGLTFAAACGVVFPFTSVAHAQIPEGLDPAAVAAMIPSTISVPAGQTTSVDVGVPVNVSFSEAGWSISSAGTGVTVTAPNQPGSQVSVPVSAGGYSATITLVAEDTSGGGHAAGSAGAETTPEQVDQPGAGSAGGHGGAASSGEAAPTPPRQPAAPVETAQAERMYFDGEIQDNVLTVSVSVTEAVDLARLASGNAEGLKVRYLDINGQIIEGVQRDIDMGARTMTLTYPEGQTPDNPFIIEVVRDDTVAKYIVTITATNVPVAQPNSNGGETGTYADVAQGAEEARQNNESNWVWWALLTGAIVVLAAIVAITFAVRKRSRRRR